MISSEHSGWYKSSYSGGSQAECLEVSRNNPDVPVRDSKTAHGPALVFSLHGWTAFVTAVKEGHLEA
ncbi:DUF397 domain-containing protein [Streptomyces azureus]|uniref:Regulatory protein n=1 Tax=Streptomyces azureus TaxID=146537 RepID=A0A0K8PFG8_STRAJ|nr:DUF397 domain-containing protein [Streptomyces azureus]GAP46630.1 regulatory protein [Streptomyces azureus]